MAGRWRGGGPWWSVGLRHDDRQVAVGPRRVVRRPRLRGLRVAEQRRDRLLSGRPDTHRSPLAFGWDEGERPFGQAAPLLVCVGGGVRVSLAADPGITVTPGELRTNGQNLPLRFQVAVQPGTTGGITYTQTSVASGAVLHTARVLTVTPSGSGWRFVKPN